MKKLYFIILICIILSNNAFTQQFSSGNCCCGTWNQIFFPNLDFEDGPYPPVGGFIVYGTGSVFGGWTVTRATIDHCEASHAGLGNGNPNGASNFIDLHGSPGFGAISYKLNGLKPGASYRIEFWTAQNGGNHSSTGTVKVAGGAWLDQSWTVTISGAIFWFKVTGSFMAMATMADLEFSSVGDLIYAGTLIDDISIFECPGDIEAPKVMNEPINEEYNCIDELPSPAILDVVDDCDINPIIKFSEKRNKKDECEQTILRNWEVSDHCGNSKIISQEIKVVDLEPPKIIQSGSNKYVNCSNYSNAAFSTWLNTHGGAVATDNCKKVFWEYSYDQLPKFACDTTIVTFSAKDNCGNESLIYLYYILTDTLKPRLVKSADIVRLQCSKFAKDSLRSWLLNHGNAQAIDSCSPISWKNNFNGDSNALKIVVDFIAFDKCGNKLLVPGLFEQIDAPDTNYITSYNCFTKKIKTDTTFFNLPGCDNVVINKILGLQLDTTFFNKISCDPNQKQEIIHLISNNTCDSIILFSYQYQAPDTNRLSEFICGKKDTSIIYESFKGIYCDSIIIKTQFPGIENIQNIVKYSCDTSQVGITNFNFTNHFGCDSIIQIDTRFNAVSISQRDSLVCGLKANYYDTLKFSIANCDSLHIIHYLGLIADTTKINKSTCDPLNVGIKINKYNNLNQCDSLVIINTTFVPIQPSWIQQNTCDPFHKVTDSLFLKSSQNCDSLIITTYLIKAIDTTKINKTTCDPNHVLLELKKINGQFCDSIVITNFSYQPVDLAYQSIRTCNKDSIRTDTMAYSNQNLCDSLIIINYVYKPIELNYLTKDITCYGYMDGTLEISKLLNAQAPLQFILDQKVYSTQLKWNNLDKGLHTLYLIDNDGCFSDSVVLDIKEPAPIKIDIGKDLILNKSEQIIFSEKSNKHFTSYHWNPSGLFDCATCEFAKGSISQDTTIYLMVEDENGCISSDTLNIRINKEYNYYVPNVFSPNGDNLNDRFYIYGSENLNIQWIRIFDRWGALVFNKSNPMINHSLDGWDGTFNGEPLNPGVFTYVFSISNADGTPQIIYGDITISR